MRNVVLLAAMSATAFLFGLPLVSQASAQTQTPPPVAAWRVDCSNDGKTLDCRAVQQALRDSNQVVAEMTIRVPAETKKPVMMVQVPLGILVTEPLQLKVDDAQPERISIQTCTASGCFAGAPVTDALLAAMRNGKQLRVTFQSSNRQPVSVDLALLGFAPAYDKVK